MGDHEIYKRIVGSIKANTYADLRRRLFWFHLDFLSVMSPVFGLSRTPKPADFHITEEIRMPRNASGTHKDLGGSRSRILIEGPSLERDEFLELMYEDIDLENLVGEVLNRVPNFNNWEELSSYVATTAHETGHRLARIFNPQLGYLSRVQLSKHRQDRRFFPWAYLLVEDIADLSALVYFRIKGLVDQDLSEDCENRFGTLARYGSSRSLIFLLRHLSSSSTLSQARKHPFFNKRIEEEVKALEQENRSLEESNFKRRGCATLRSMDPIFY